jgi:hypothetical protein
LLHLLLLLLLLLVMMMLLLCLVYHSRLFVDHYHLLPLLIIMHQL